MDEVGTAVVAISLVLIAVFVPTAFIPGISGQFYLQFAVTIAVSTVDLGLQFADAVAGAGRAPVQAARRTSAAALRPGALRQPACRRLQPRLRRGSRTAMRASSRCLVGARSRSSHARRLRRAARRRRSTLVRRCRAASSRRSTRAMRSSSSNCRTAPRCRAPTRWCKRASKIIQETPGVADAVAFAGFSGATFTNASNAGVDLRAASSRSRSACAQGQSGDQHHRPALRPAAGDRGGVHHRASRRRPVRGIGNAGGFKMQLQERDSADVRRILRRRLRDDGPRANQTPGLTGVFTTFSRLEPADLSRDRPRQGAHARTCRSPTSSRRCRSISARPTSTTSTPSAASIRCARRPISSFRIERDDILRAEGALGDRRAGAARHARRDPRRHRARPRAALQHVRLGAAAGQRRARRVVGRRRSTRWRGSPRRCCRRARASSGPSLPSRSARPATRRSSSSACRCCSSSSCWRRNMRAGRCRSRSS